MPLRARLSTQRSTKLSQPMTRGVLAPTLQVTRRYVARARDLSVQSAMRCLRRSALGFYCADSCRCPPLRAAAPATNGVTCGWEIRSVVPSNTRGQKTQNRTENKRGGDAGARGTREPTTVAEASSELIAGLLARAANSGRKLRRRLTACVRCLVLQRLRTTYTCAYSSTTKLPQKKLNYHETTRIRYYSTRILEYYYAKNMHACA